MAVLFSHCGRAGATYTTPLEPLTSAASRLFIVAVCAWGLAITLLELPAEEVKVLVTEFVGDVHQ